MKAMIPLCIALAAATACHGRSQQMQRTQQDYQVVQEGSANGVTSTIDGPAEVRPPVATDTNVDTTTNFTLPPVAANGSAPPANANGSIASTLPQTTNAPVSPAPAARPHGSETINAPMTSATPPPQPQRARTTTTANTTTRAPQPPTDTTASQPPAQTDTTSPASQPQTDSAQKTDTTSTDSDKKKQKDKKEKDNTPPPSDTSSTSSQPPPPPPPPMTDGVLPDING